MKRREVVRFLSLIIALSPWEVMAGASTRRIAVIMAASEGDRDVQSRLKSVRMELQRLGWRETDIRFEYHFLAGATDRIASVATRVVAGKPDIILTHSTHLVAQITKATSDIPVIFAQGTDPVALGIVQSLAHPGGNATGFTTYEQSMGAKWFGLLTEMVPRLKRVLILKNPNNPSTTGYLHALEPVARSSGIGIEVAGGQDRLEISRVIRELGGGNAMIVMPDPTNAAHHVEIVTDASTYGVPAVYPYRYFAGRVPSGGVADRWSPAISG
ncbi:ABC transporter substrate-binding protein [Alsobacter sp. SYSU BS001988]